MIGAGINTLVSLVVSIFILRVFWSASQGFGPAIERLSSPQFIRLRTDNHSPMKLASLAGVLILLLAPIASGHTIHMTEEGEGFDAPKRFLIDVDDQYVWVEFMMWPPKAITETEVLILPASNETVEITDAWIEVVYPTENDEVRMRTNLDREGDYSLWTGPLNFPFSGNQTVQIWLEVDGRSTFTEIPVDVEGPPLLPVWVAWLIALTWPTMIVLFWKNISNKIPRRVE